ncbi:MAG: hypothetical protein ACYDC0_16290 [Acidimicrobiales bacterium]
MATREQLLDLLGSGVAYVLGIDREFGVDMLAQRCYNSDDEEGDDETQ